ncbi:hypothetical protein AgCh_016695 [Apium graveolens]
MELVARSWTDKWFSAKGSKMKLMGLMGYCLMMWKVPFGGDWRSVGGEKVKKRDIEGFIDALDTHELKIHKKVTPLRNMVLLLVASFGDTTLHLAVISGHLVSKDAANFQKYEHNPRVGPMLKKMFDLYRG